MSDQQSAPSDQQPNIRNPQFETRHSPFTIRNSKFLTLLESSPVPLLSDGAMGTMLNARGAGFGQCFDALNLTQPTLVTEIHLAYLEAGSDILQTNTFGANRYKLAAHGLEGKVAEINRLGVELARQVGATGGSPVLGATGRVPVPAGVIGRSPVLIAGDVGPLGVRLAPFGRVQPEQARLAFREQIAALVEAGVDLLIIETFADLYEIREAIAAAREVETMHASSTLTAHASSTLTAHASPLPLVASMTFTRDDRTLLGDSPAKVARTLVEAGAEVIGINCSGGPAQIYRILRQMRQAVSGADTVDRADTVRPYFSVMPNAGWPEQVGGRIMYPANPDYFGEYAHAFCEAGASLIGGCCGTTPQHIAAMRRALDRPEGCGPDILQIPEVAEAAEVSQTAEAPSRFAQKLAAGKFVISVEMDPPRGLSTHKLIAGANLLTEAGADVINIADSPMARMRMSPWAVCSVIQREFNIETVLHFPTRGRNLLRVQGDLLAAHALGVRNVFVVMGDPTSVGDYPDAMDNYDLVPSGLIKLIKQSFNLGLDHAGADIGQPTSFFVGCALNLTPQNPGDEIKNLRRKIKAGSDYILTQPVYQPETAKTILRLYEEKYGPLEIPVLVGVLPLYGIRHATFLNNEVPGVTIPEAMLQRLRAAGEAAPQEGVRMTLELIEQIRPWARGVYLMPQFSRYDLAAEIVEEIKR